jgi:peptidoglycan/LPS O-acetylase OafA/YrhL
VIRALTQQWPGVFDVHATGWRAIGMCGALWVVVVPATYAVSRVTFRLVEEPMIALGRSWLAGAHRMPQGERAG